MNILVRNSDNKIVLRCNHALPTVTGYTGYTDVPANEYPYAQYNGTANIIPATPANEVNRCKAWAKARILIADVNLATTALSRGEQLCLMNYRDLMTDDDWTALIAAYS